MIFSLSCKVYCIVVVFTYSYWNLSLIGLHCRLLLNFLCWFYSVSPAMASFGLAPKTVLLRHLQSFPPHRWKVVNQFCCRWFFFCTFLWQKLMLSRREPKTPSVAPLLLFRNTISILTLTSVLTLILTSSALMTPFPSLSTIFTLK